MGIAILEYLSKLYILLYKYHFILFFLYIYINLYLEFYKNPYKNLVLYTYIN